MDSTMKNKFQDLYNPESIMFVKGDDFDRQIYIKSWLSSKINFSYFDRVAAVGNDSRYSKFIATAHSHDDVENVDYEEPISIFVDRQNNYKALVYYGHDGWIY